MSAIIKHTNKDELLKTSWLALSEETKKNYQYDLNIFFDFVKKEIDDVTPLDIIEFVNFLRAKGFKNATVNRRLASVSKLFRVYTIAGLIQKNPVDIAKENKKIYTKTIRTNKSILKISDIQKAVSGYSVSGNDRISLIIKFLAKTGLRISEAINIKHVDIKPLYDDFLQIRILGKGQKERFIVLDINFVNEIKTICNHKEYLFSNTKNRKLNRKSVYRNIRKRFFETTGLNVHPHLLRHFYATEKIVREKQDIKSVSRYLGHSEVGVTLNMYVDSSLDPEQTKIEI